MNCRRAKKLVFEFIDGLADESVRLELEKHLSQCGDCERLASQLTRSMDLIHRAPVERLDDNFAWNVRLGIHKERRAMQEAVASQGALFKAWNVRYAASAAAGLLMMVALGWTAIGTGLVTWNGGAATGTGVTATPIVAQDDSAAPEEVLQTPASPFTNRSNMQTVSEGGIHGPMRREAARPGAITAGAAGLDLDSLVRVEMSNKTEAERIEYLQKRIDVLNAHLERCKLEKHE